MQLPGFLQKLTAKGKSASQQFGEVARDLVTIEVNTILKENMTAARMPGLAAAMLEIGDAYFQALHAFRVDFTGVWGESRPVAGGTWSRLGLLAQDQSKAFVIPDPLKFGLMFDQLQEIARQIPLLKAGGHLEYPNGDSDRYLLRRIEKNCKALSALLANHEEFRDKDLTIGDIVTEQDVFNVPMTAREILIIRKIWEVGTEEVVAQTVVSLDGDVTSRMSKSLFDLRKGEDKSENEKMRIMLLSLHDKSLDTAIGNWRAIVAAAASVVSGLVGRTAPPSQAPPSPPN